MVDYLNAKKPKGLSKIEDSLGAYKKLINSRSYIVIISDFLYPLEELRRALFYFKNHKLVLIQTLDKLEKNLDIEGDFKLKDLETDEVLRTFISPFARKEYKNMLDNHNAEIKQICAQIGAKFYSANTGQTVFDVFYDVLGRKR